MNGRVRQARLVIHEMACRSTGLGGYSLELFRFVKPQLLDFEDAMKLQKHKLGIVLKSRNPENRLLGILEIVSVYPGKDPDTSVSEICFHEETPVPRWSVDLRSGKTLWEKPEIYDYDRINDFMATQGVLLVLGWTAEKHDGGISALDAADGAVLWQKRNHTSIAGDAEGRRICFAVTMAAAASVGSISCCDVRTGRELWEDDWMGEAVMGGNLAAANGRTYNVELGTERWTSFSGLSSDICRADGVIAFTDDKGVLVAARERSGQELWAYPLGGSMDFAVISEGILYLVSGTRCLAFDMEQ